LASAARLRSVSHAHPRPVPVRVRGPSRWRDHRSPGGQRRPGDRFGSEAPAAVTALAAESVSVDERDGSARPTEVRPPLVAMLEANSVAVVGASARAGSFGEQMMVQLLRGGFRGSVYPVNPRY